MIPRWLGSGFDSVSPSGTPSDSHSSFAAAANSKSRSVQMCWTAVLSSWTVDDEMSAELS